jgi:heat shock protein HslJ
MTMRRMLIGAAVLLMVTGCGDETGATAGTDGGPDGRTFLSESIIEGGAPRELVDGTRIRLEFTDDGRIVANAGCNTLFSDVSIGDRTLDVGLVGGTEMGCDEDLHDQDTWLAAFLESDPEWALDGDRLTLTSGTIEMVLLDRMEADPDRPLEGTRWVVDTIITGDAASSMFAGTEDLAWLMIDGDRFTASSGCRDVDGSVAVDDDRLRFSDAVQTDPICPPELEEVDTVLLTILTGDVDFEITANRLRLDHPDGVGLGLHADE